MITIWLFKMERDLDLFSAVVVDDLGIKLWRTIISALLLSVRPGFCFASVNTS